MEYSKEEFARYRMDRVFEALGDAEALATLSRWTATTGRIYYACFYAVSAYLILNSLSAHTHAGVKALFHKELISTGKLDRNFGPLYNQLLKWRQDADYVDFTDFSEQTVAPMLPLVKQLIEL